jgi:hypothetical protein
MSPEMAEFSACLANCETTVADRIDTMKLVAFEEEEIGAFEAAIKKGGRRKRSFDWRRGDHYSVGARQFKLLNPTLVNNESGDRLGRLENLSLKEGMGAESISPIAQIIELSKPFGNFRL